MFYTKERVILYKEEFSSYFYTLSTQFRGALSSSKRTKLDMAVTNPVIIFSNKHI